MDKVSQQLAATLRQAGQSTTATRQAVFRALSKQEPLTMHELASKLHGQADRASVYRTIALFERLGIVQRLQIGWKYKLELSNAFQEHHHHLTCVKCGRVTPLHEDDRLEQRLLELASEQHFQASDHQIEIRGLCSNCQ